jgi:hypothetical protein
VTGQYPEQQLTSVKVSGGDDLMSTQVTGSLQDQLDQISAHVPAQVTERIEAAIREITESGTAPGLPVGDKAPDFTAPDQQGRPVSLHERLAAGPAVVVFYRGDWYPFCNAHLRAVQERCITAQGPMNDISPRRLA